jgi:acetate kinase
VAYELSWPGEKSRSHEVLLGDLLNWLRKQPAGQRLIAVGHRVVHGGTKFHHPVVVDDRIYTALEALIPLAPLHQPHNLTPIKAIHHLFPALPQVACFDTAFHRTNPRIAQMFALPRRYDEAGVKRYGFHGLSYEYIASVLDRYLGDAPAAKVIVAHLGNGASLCALENGVSIASSMGFTALEGVPMGTRTGSIDPGVLLYLLQQQQLSSADVERILYKESGLLGVSGISSDMRVLENSDSPDAAEAIDLFVYRIGREIGSLAAALGGLDALVFTAGIGEHSSLVRSKVCAQAAWLGITVDQAANESHGPRISTAASQTSAWVIPTNEEAQIANHTARLLSNFAW